MIGSSCSNIDFYEDCVCFGRRNSIEKLWSLLNLTDVKRNVIRKILVLLCYFFHWKENSCR